MSPAPPRAILALEPEVEQGLSYGHPAFKLGGKTIATSFLAFVRDATFHG